MQARAVLEHRRMRLSNGPQLARLSLQASVRRVENPMTASPGRSKIPKTMIAARIAAVGAPHDLVLAKVDTPTPGPGGS